MNIVEQIFSLVDSCLQMDNQNEFIATVTKIEDLLKNINGEKLDNVEMMCITKLMESKMVNQVVTQIIEKVNTISYDMPREDIKDFLNLKSLTSIYEGSRLIDNALDIQLKVRLVKESPAKAYYGDLIKNWDLDDVVEDNLVSKEEIYQAAMNILPLKLNDKLGISTNPFDEYRYIDDDQMNRYANDLINIYFTQVDRKPFLKLLLDGDITAVIKYLNIDNKNIIDKINELNFSENELFNVALSKYDLFKGSNNFDFFDDEMLMFFQAKYPKFYDFLQRKTLDAIDFNMVTEFDDSILENLQRTGDFTMILNSLKKQGKTQEEIIDFFRHIVDNVYSRDNKLKESPDFLRWCIDNNQYDLIRYFRSNAFSEEISKKLAEKIGIVNIDFQTFNEKIWELPGFLKLCLTHKNYHLITNFGKAAINEENFQMICRLDLLEEIDTFGLLWSSENSQFLKSVIENKKFKYLPLFNYKAFTPENIAKLDNPRIFSDLVKYGFPEFLSSSSEFLKVCLNNKKYDWIFKFSNIVFPIEYIEKVVEPQAFSEIIKFAFPEVLKHSSKFLNACLENQKYDWINNFAENAYDSKNIAKLDNPRIFSEFVKCGFPEFLSSSSEFLKVCLNNKKYDWIFKFSNIVFPIEYIEKVVEPQAFSEIIKFAFPEVLKHSSKFLNACLENQKYDWINNFTENAYDSKNIQQIINKLGMNFFLKIHKREVIDKIYFLYKNGKLKLNEYDAAILTTLGNYIDLGMQSSIIYDLMNYINNLYGTITIEEIKNNLAIEISNSISEEIKLLGSVLFSFFGKSKDPVKEIKELEKIFLKKDLPYLGKLFIVFQNLHPEESLKEDMIQYGDRISPVLKNSDSSKIWSNHYAIIWSDLLKCALGSNNRSLKEFINQIDQGNQLYMLYSFGKIKFDDFTLEQKQILNGFVSQLNTLYNMSQKGKEKPNKLSGNILEDLNKLVELIESTEKKNLADKIIRMYGIFEGINSLEGAKEYLELYSKKADLRHRSLIEKGFKLEPGDFIKGIGSIRFLAPTLQNGAVAQEFLGYAAGRDTTPLDTDLARFTSDYGNFRDNISGSMAREYAQTPKEQDGFWVVLKNDDRFQYTRLAPLDVDYDKYKLLEKNVSNNAGRLYSIGEVENPKFMEGKLETFYTLGCTGNSAHYGIRTGFASSEIDFIISKPYKNLNYDPRICVEVAMNGFYIPVVDMDGHLVFTPRDYDELREKMQGLSYYDADKYDFSSSLANQQINAIVANLNDITSDTLDKNTKVNKYFEQIFNEMGYKFKPGFDGDIAPGSVELINTGSTSRLTNANKEGDYDFILRIDKNIISEPANLLNFKNELLSKIEFTRDDGGNHPRLKEVKIPGINTPVDIDLTIVGKTNQLNYSTERSLEDRLKTISKQDLEKYQYVLANIILAKQTLKAAKCYKPKHSGDNIPKEEKCGLGGVGIENWVLQNGGSFQQAAESFLAVAQGKNFEEFCKSYYIWDFGENHKAVKEGTYVHDNFIDNMTPSGYEKMKKTLRQYLSEVKNVEQQVTVGIFDTLEEEHGRKF